MNLTFILPLAIASLSELGVSLERIKNILIMGKLCTFFITVLCISHIYITAFKADIGIKYKE